MTGRSLRSDPNSRKRRATLLILLGILLIIIGIVVMFFINADSSSGGKPQEDVEQTTEVSQTMEEEITLSSDDESSEQSPSEGSPEAVSEELLGASELGYFIGEEPEPERFTFMISDGTPNQEGNIPAFHTITEISVAAGSNPKTNEESEILLAVMSAVPDREFSVSVLVSAENSEIDGTTPDDIQGIQWTLTYADGEFKKTERSVTGDGLITQLAAEDFNIRFEGKESTAQIEFFGPIGTQYYAVMIYDETYCTLIRP